MSGFAIRRKDKYARYAWLIDTLRRHGPCSLREIDRRWVEETTLNPDGEPLSRRTFQQHKEAINELELGVEIVCSHNLYSVCTDNHNPIGAWLWQTISLRRMLTESKTLNDRIVVEEVPSSDRWLQPILTAIRENRRLRIGYHPFGREASETVVSPYFVQMSDRRWYLFGLRGTETALKAYALDRMEACSMMEETFALPEEFSATEYLKEHGIGRYENIHETEVVLRAYGRQVDLLRTLPLHTSQHETKTAEDKAEFTYILRPTTRFFGDILACGKYVKVLSPEWVRRHLKETLEKIVTYYK